MTPPALEIFWRVADGYIGIVVVGLLIDVSPSIFMEPIESPPLLPLLQLTTASVPRSRETKSEVHA